MGREARGLCWYCKGLWRIWKSADSLVNALLSRSLHCFPFLLSPLSPGYGNIAPSTEGGKIFCILYAIFGIPLFGFLLAGIGDQLGTIFGKSIARVEKVFRVSIVSIQTLLTGFVGFSLTGVRRQRQGL